MKYRITTVRSNENGHILYWRAEYKKGLFSPWKLCRSYDDCGRHPSLDIAVDVITEHHMHDKFDKLISFKEEFV